MKTFSLAAAAVAFGATTAFAGGPTEPVIELEPVEIIEDTTAGSSGGLIVPLIIVALIAAAVSSGD